MAKDAVSINPQSSVCHLLEKDYVAERSKRAVGLLRVSESLTGG